MEVVDGVKKTNKKTTHSSLKFLHSAVLEACKRTKTWRRTLRPDLLWRKVGAGSFSVLLFFFGFFFDRFEQLVCVVVDHLIHISGTND